jgi:hypothetical protein
MAKQWKIPMFSRRASTSLGTIEADANGVFTARSAAEDADFAAMEAIPYDPNTNPASRQLSGTAKARSLANQMIYAGINNATGTYTMHMMARAPAEFAGIQVTVHGANSGANTIEVCSAMPAQFGDGLTPLDAAGAAITPTQHTIGSTDLNDFSNPGGGSTLTGQITDASGSAGTFSPGSITFDWLLDPSKPRVDKNALPLYMVRLYGVNPPAYNVAESNSNHVNPFYKVFDGDFMSGFWGSKQITSNSGGNVSQGWIPPVSVRFLLVGQRMNTLMIAGDSLDQGDQPGTASPWGANISGWGRKLVNKLNNANIPTSYLCAAKTGAPSYVFHEVTRKAILARRLTHLFLRPWSANDFGLGAQGVTDALVRTTKLLAMADLYGIEVTLIEPGPMGTGTMEGYAATCRAYCQKAKAYGRNVISLNDYIGVPGSPGVINPLFKSDVDALHINELGHETIAAGVFFSRTDYGF